MKESNESENRRGDEGKGPLDHVDLREDTELHELKMRNLMNEPFEFGKNACLFSLADDGEIYIRQVSSVRHKSVPRRVSWLSQVFARFSERQKKTKATMAAVLIGAL